MKTILMKNKIRSLYTDPLYRNSLALMLNSAIGAFFGLLFWIVAARTMPAKEIGLATAAISAAALIVGLSRLGLDAGLIRYLPESKNKNGLYSTIVMVTLVLALVLTAVFMLGINIFSPALFFLHDGSFLPVFFVYITVTSIYSVQNMAFISIRRADLSLRRTWD
jgi:O-antigen/teichoic acid export membrane protein